MRASFWLFVSIQNPPATVAKACLWLYGRMRRVCKLSSIVVYLYWAVIHQQAGL